jgi:hypothetical protein
MFAAGSPSRHPDAPRAIAALNWSSGIASRRAGNGPSSIDPFQKSILDFAVDPVQPLFGAFCPFLIRLPHRLELRNSCFGGVKLMRKLERRVERMLMISFGEVRRVVQHAQDRLSRSIELTGGGVFESRCERYDSVRFGIGTIGLSTHRPPRRLLHPLTAKKGMIGVIYLFRRQRRLLRLSHARNTRVADATEAAVAVSWVRFCGNVGSRERLAP